MPIGSTPGAASYKGGVNAPAIRVWLLLAVALGPLALGLIACGPEEAASSESGDARGAGAPAVAELEIPDDAPRVAFLGDSLAAGRGLAADEAFPAVLQRMFVERGRPFRLVNAGLSGDKTGGGLARLDWLLRQKPDVVVIELGANDGLRGDPVATIEANLVELITRVRAAGATPLLLGMRMPPSHGGEYVRAFDAVFPRVAERTGVAFVPFLLEGVAGVRELNLADGIHPTAEGHRRIAANLEEALAGVLP